VDDLLAANPQARFLCMIDLNTPYWLTRKFAYDSFDAISHAASDPQWVRITTEWMCDFIAYSEQKYGDKIEAYILSGGGTSEWYEYDRGRSSRVKNGAWCTWCKKNGYEFGEDVPGESTLRKAVHENVIYDPATEMEKIQYWRFHNEIIADAVLNFAKAARSMIGRDKEIGVFFGYYMVSDSKLVSFGHLDYERVFASPDIDFLISPGTYNDRMIGGGSGPQLVRGTALRYGKRYLHEIDHRTHCVSRSPGSDNKWKTQAENEAGLKREAAFAVVNHASYWWFDMWGGWYQKEETRQLIGQLQKVSENYAKDRSPSVAETPAFGRSAERLLREREDAALLGHGTQVSRKAQPDRSAVRRVFVQRPAGNRHVAIQGGLASRDVADHAGTGGGLETACVQQRSHGRVGVRAGHL